jgi:hypothetical protein
MTMACSPIARTLVIAETKATMIYRRTGNLRAVQLLLGHRRIDYVPRLTISRRAATRLIINANGQAAGK